MKTNSFIKKISVLSIIILLIFCIAGCSSSIDVKGTYSIYSVELAPGITDTLAIINFESHQNQAFEFRLEENGFATVSYIYFMDLSGTKSYQANIANGPTTYRVNGSQIILEGGFVGVGVLDISVYDGGWLILNYKIENQLVYTAKYRK